MLNRGFESPATDDLLGELERRARAARGTVLTATTLANSGHPGGSFSSMEIYTLLYGCARIHADDPRRDDRDRIVISHGHTSPGAYAALAEAGFFAAEDVAAHFRKGGSPFEGHVERSVPGIEWSTGNLGQGLSAGVGLALGARLTGADWHTFVVMSDGEQQKGQVAEARRLAVKERLGGLTAIVDWNHVQISGHTDEVMPVPIKEDWEADGWFVLECDGHDLAALYDAVREAVAADRPSVVLAHTVIGKSVGFMEDLAEFHGRGLTEEEYVRAMEELGLDPAALERARSVRNQVASTKPLEHRTPAVRLNEGTPREYTREKNTDNRSAWGSALVDLAEANAELPIAVLDCDLATSVKTEGFAKARPEGFIQCGVGEHNAATISGALSSVPGVLTFWSDFGVFGIDEVYNQQRLNDINGAGVKVVVTHCGLDVGEDGKTHQCLDYIGALRDFFGWKVIVPADPNQTDRVIRTAAAMEGCVAVAMGRSKLPVILGEDGGPLFGGNYRFTYGDIVWARSGDDACILTLGTVAGAAVDAADVLKAEGLAVAVGIAASPLALDDEQMRRAAKSGLLITAEDHSAHTGLGASVGEWLLDRGAACRLVRLGVTGYKESAAASYLLKEAGLDAEGIARSVRQALDAW